MRAYTGFSGELVYNTDTGRLHAMSGDIPGGAPLARCGRRVVAGQNASLAAADAYVAVTSLSAPVTLTLPPAANFEPGQPLYIADETGLCSADAGRTITIAAAGSDTIAGQPAVTMGSPYQKLTFHSNGSNLWTYA
ncbi:hypothetical protein DA075_10310 [Methylobacterium currus]|uniref:Uncharacterized protein n=1 Tax=Methylobacterium currus TaxID=2051553 RepID=A0A2R4WIA4_9HYPH|nr:hypothetical protein DA075_10310 [Methylobacterium currus]